MKENEEAAAVRRLAEVHVVEKREVIRSNDGSLIERITYQSGETNETALFSGDFPEVKAGKPLQLGNYQTAASILNQRAKEARAKAQTAA